MKTIFKQLGLFLLYAFGWYNFEFFISYLFGSGWLSIIGAAVIICVISYALRNGYIKKLNYLSEQREHYNENFKNKFNHIIKMFEFRVQFIISAAATFIMVIIVAAISAATSEVSFGFAFLISLLIGVLAVAVFAAVNFVIWLLSFRKSFKVKKY